MDYTPMTKKYGTIFPVISPVIDSPVMVDFTGGKSLQVARNSFFDFPCQLYVQQ